MTKTRVTLTVQKVIEHKDDDDYQEKLDALVEKLGRSFDSVDVESEDQEDEEDEEQEFTDDNEEFDDEEDE